LCRSLPQGWFVKVDATDHFELGYHSNIYYDDLPVIITLKCSWQGLITLFIGRNELDLSSLGLVDNIFQCTLTFEEYLRFVGMLTFCRGGDDKGLQPESQLNKVYQNNEETFGIRSQTCKKLMPLFSNARCCMPCINKAYSFKNSLKSVDPVSHMPQMPPVLGEEAVLAQNDRELEEHSDCHTDSSSNIEALNSLCSSNSSTSNSQGFP